MISDSTGVKGQSGGEMVVVVVVVVAVVLGGGVGFLLNLPTNMEEIVDGTRQAQRAVGVVAVHFPSLLKKGLQKRMVEI